MTYSWKLMYGDDDILLECQTTATLYVNGQFVDSLLHDSSWPGEQLVGQLESGAEVVVRSETPHLRMLCTVLQPGRPDGDRDTQRPVVLLCHNDRGGVTPELLDQLDGLLTELAQRGYRNIAVSEAQASSGSSHGGVPSPSQNGVLNF